MSVSFFLFSFYWQCVQWQGIRKLCVIIRSECSFFIMSKTLGKHFSSHCQFFVLLPLICFGKFYQSKDRMQKKRKKKKSSLSALGLVRCNHTHFSWYLEQFSQLISGAVKERDCSNAFMMILKNTAHSPSNLKGNSLVISTHPQGCTHSTAYQSIVYNGSRIIQLAQGPLMVLKIKEDNTFSVPPSLLPLGAMFLFDQVAVTLSPPSIIIRVLLFINIH